jgi:hypothetical protein
MINLVAKVVIVNSCVSATIFKYTDLDICDTKLTPSKLCRVN